ncbi:unnamed protein product [Victoria cruziana]
MVTAKLHHQWTCIARFLNKVEGYGLFMDKVEGYGLFMDKVEAEIGCLMVNEANKEVRPLIEGQTWMKVARFFLKSRHRCRTS